MRQQYNIAVVTNDIYTRRCPVFGSQSGRDRILWCWKPVAAPILPSARCLDQLAAIEQLEQRFADLNLVFLESGGDIWLQPSAQSW